MKEPKGYRDELEEILRHFNGKHVLTISDVAEYTGKCWRYTKKTWFGTKTEITATTLARLLTT